MRKWNLCPYIILLGSLIVASVNCIEDVDSNSEISQRAESVRVSDSSGFFSDLEKGASNLDSKIRVKRGPTKIDVDHIVLAQQYVPTLCFEQKLKSRSKSCVTDDSSKDPNKWTIHGSWPTKPGKLLTNCPNPYTFTGAEVRNLEVKLKEKWTDVYLVHTHRPTVRNAYQFWKHEWDKHGTCAIDCEPLNTVHKYFARTIQLFDDYNFVKALQKRNYVPGSKPENFARLISYTFKKQGRVSCFKEANKDEQYLKQVEMCFNKDNLKMIDCPGPLIRGCNPEKDIKYMAWSYFKNKLKSGSRRGA